MSDVTSAPCARRRTSKASGHRRELRHTFVSVMSVSGVAVEEIARLAGHASSRTTETIYRHELRPVITTGADVMHKIFTAAEHEG